MKNDVIPDADRISRFCRPRHVDGDQVLGAAFLPRAIDSYLSVNWVEYLQPNSPEDERRALREIYAKKFQIGAAARIALLNVGGMRSYVREVSPDKRELAARHEPIIGEGEDLSHSGVFNIRHDDELIAELLVATIQETFSAR